MSRTPATLDILLVEDNPADTRLVVEHFRDAGVALRLTSADRLAHALAMLARQSFHAVLLDLGLPDSDGLDTFARTRAAAPDAAIVVLSGLDDEELAIHAVRLGAQDYLVKGQVDGYLLRHAIRYAVERKRVEREMEERDERFRQIVDNISEVVFLTDVAFREMIYVSPAYERVWGRPRDSLYRDPSSFLDAVPEPDRADLMAKVAQVQRGEDPGESEFRVIRPDGTARWVISHATPIRDPHGEVYRIAGVALDVTRRRQAEDEVLSVERRLRALFDTVGLIVLGLDTTGQVEYVNPFLVQLSGFAADEMVGRSWIDTFVPGHARDRLRAAFADLIGRDAHTRYRNPIVTRDGRERTIVWHNTVVRDAEGRAIGTLSIGEDVTEHELLQTQFQQAQKMEAVGRLAGGVAHDFNNLLTVISGHAELMLPNATGEQREDLAAIQQAAASAATLTRQLLAFSRQQVLDLRILELNDVVTGAEKILRRLIGEDIRFSTVLTREPTRVRADAGQLEQVLMNLAVNARDAMPDGGTLMLETANVQLSEEYSRAHLPVPPGPYVMMAVTDSGIGMDAATRERVFEPFFTTKGPGKGTGLGLATVYGIVKQLRGFIWVYSEPGHGTTFKVYLPQVTDAVSAKADSGHAPAPRGGETILLVEDAAAVRSVARQILERQGYSVIEAPDPDIALAIAERHPTPIHLLLTDVVMPVMNGRQLAERVATLRRDTRVLFTSGYTDDALTRTGVLDGNMPYLQKPFTADALARKVREVLDAPR